MFIYNVCAVIVISIIAYKIINEYEKNKRKREHLEQLFKKKSWEEDKNNAKREINIINPLYIPTIEDDIDRIMQYGLGTQYINKKLKRADNIRLTS